MLMKGTMNPALSNTTNIEGSLLTTCNHTDDEEDSLDHVDSVIKVISFSWLQWCLESSSTFYSEEPGYWYVLVPPACTANHVLHLVQPDQAPHLPGLPQDTSDGQEYGDSRDRGSKWKLFKLQPRILAQPSPLSPLSFFPANHVYPTDLVIYIEYIPQLLFYTILSSSAQVALSFIMFIKHARILNYTPTYSSLILDFL